jgi:hypothetical protein
MNCTVDTASVNNSVETAHACLVSKIVSYCGFSKGKKVPKIRILNSPCLSAGRLTLSNGYRATKYNFIKFGFAGVELSVKKACRTSGSICYR